MPGPLLRAQAAPPAPHRERLVDVVVHEPPATFSNAGVGCRCTTSTLAAPWSQSNAAHCRARAAAMIATRAPSHGVEVRLLDIEQQDADALRRGVRGLRRGRLRRRRRPGRQHRAQAHRRPARAPLEVDRGCATRRGIDRFVQISAIGVDEPAARRTPATSWRALRRGEAATPTPRCATSGLGVDDHPARSGSPTTRPPATVVGSVPTVARATYPRPT